MVRVAADFAHMLGQRHQQIGQVVFAHFQHQIGGIHGGPILGVRHQRAVVTGHARQRVHGQMPGADVSGLGIVWMRAHQQIGFERLQLMQHLVHAGLPMRRLFCAGLGRHAQQTALGQQYVLKTQHGAGCLQLGSAGQLPVGVAAVRDGHIDHAPATLAQQAQREATVDAFVVRVGRQDHAALAAGCHGLRLSRGQRRHRHGFAALRHSGKCSHQIFRCGHGLPPRLSLRVIRCARKRAVTPWSGPEALIDSPLAASAQASGFAWPPHRTSQSRS